MIIDLIEEYLKCKTIGDFEHLRNGICHFESNEDRNLLIDLINKEIAILKLMDRTDSTCNSHMQLLLKELRTNSNHFHSVIGLHNSKNL